MGWGSKFKNYFTGGGGGGSNTNNNTTQVDAHVDNEVNIEIDVDKLARSTDNVANSTQNVANSTQNIANSNQRANDLKEEELLFSSFSFEQQQELADTELQLKITEYQNKVKQQKKEDLEKQQKELKEDKHRRFITFLSIAGLIVAILGIYKKGKK